MSASSVRSGASWPDRRAGHSEAPAWSVMGDKESPCWRLAERILRIIEKVIEILGKLGLL